jgi:hypothetical protein
MTAVVAAALAALIGLVGGYYYRRREWLRDQRLAIYSAFIGSFLELVESSMSLVSLFFSFGDQMTRVPEWREASAPSMQAFEAARNRFDFEAARVHLVADDSTYSGSAEIERFVSERIRGLPPYGEDRKGMQTIRADAYALLRSFERAAARHVGVKAKAAKAS